MPSCLSDCMRAQDLRLLHAALRVARIRLSRIACDDIPDPARFRDAQNLVRQAESIANREMARNNLVPALSAAELEDEMLDPADIPHF